MPLQDHRHKGHSQSRSSGLPGPGLIHHKEFIEDLLLILLGDPDPVIPNQEAISSLCRLSQEFHRIFRFRCLSRIIQKVDEGGLEKLAVPLKSSRLHIRPETDPRVLHQRSHTCGDPFRQPRCLYRFSFYGVILQIQKVEQFQRHRFQTLSFREDIAQRRLLLLPGKIHGPECIRIPDDTGHGRFDLMGKVGHELLSPVNHIVQLLHMVLYRLRHHVETICQLTHLIRGPDVRPGGIVPGSKGICRGTEALQRSGKQPAQYKEKKGGYTEQHQRKLPVLLDTPVQKPAQLRDIPLRDDIERLFIHHGFRSDKEADRLIFLQDQIVLSGLHRKCKEFLRMASQDLILFSGEILRYDFIL